jgi:hypothetical protein
MVPHHLDACSDQRLDVAQVGALLSIAERDRDAAPARPRRASDAVDVALRDVRQVVVDPLPWRAGAQREVAQSNRSRSARARHRDLKRGRSRAGRAGAHELGPAPQRVFDIDIERYPNCGGALKIIAAPSTRSGQASKIRR